MRVKAMESSQIRVMIPTILEFFRHHGDERITRNGMVWLQNLSPDQLKDDGTCILLASEQEELVGILAVSEYGMKHSFIAVHSHHRRSGTAKILLQEMMKRMDKFYARVALDNIPSLGTCFSMGLVALKIISGPTGKPTFLMGWGNWSKKELAKGKR